MVGVTNASMERQIRTYFDGCNEADRVKMMACFVPEGVHYFPPDMYNGPFVGSSTIADRWAESVATNGSRWTVDAFVGDETRCQAVIEWTHFKQVKRQLLRGAEWYEFEASTGLITEIRAYYASPQAPELTRLELGGFDYVGRGYPTEPW